MADALIRGMLNVGLRRPEDLVAADKRPERLREVVKTFEVVAAESNAEAAQVGEIIIVAVKPQDVGDALTSIAPVVDDHHLVISIAAGVTLETIEGILKGRVRCVRSMPNTAALVGAGACALAGGRWATEEDLREVTVLFEAVGSVVRVPENLLDAVTGLSGSGPAYIFMVIEALADAGVRHGIPRAEAQLLAAPTVYGAGKFVLESGEHPAVLRDRVASPGGTTVAGLAALEARGLRAAFMEAVAAATRRAKELGLY
ncbi:MAG: pyrroline-5-carboxylate reductase [Candidatus Tectimicrobiota bacterium]